jgi:hypothetical protein
MRMMKVVQRTNNEGREGDTHTQSEREEERETERHTENLSSGSHR